MATFPNGEIPLSALTRTSAGPYLRADAAASFERVVPKFRAAIGHKLLLSDGYRAKGGPFGQIAIFEDRYPSLTSLGISDRRGAWTRTSHPSLGARWWWRRPGAAAAAVPGTSNHGWGLAADFASGINSAGTAAHKWMNANGPEHGWIWPTWAQKKPTFEPWHREYHPELDRHINSKPFPAPEPVVPDIQEDNMIIIRNRVNGAAFVVIGGRGAAILNADYDQIVKASDHQLQVTPEQFKVFEKRYLQGA